MAEATIATVVHIAPVAKHAAAPPRRSPATGQPAAAGELAAPQSLAAPAALAAIPLWASDDPAAGTSVPTPQTSPAQGAALLAQSNPASPSIRTPLRLGTTVQTDTTPIVLPECVREVLRSPGRPLDHVTRLQMQTHFAQCTPIPTNNPTAELFAAPTVARVSGPGAPSELEAESLAHAVPSRRMTETVHCAPDFGHIRLHTDNLAARSVRALGTQAFAFGQHVVIDGSHYAPGTSGGARLLAHELAHTLQSRLSAARVLMRDTPRTSQTDPETTAETNVSMSVTMDGMYFQFSGAVLRAGSPRVQIIEIILRRLLGRAYRKGLEKEVIARLDRTNVAGSGQLNPNARESPGTPIHDIAIVIDAAVTLLNIFGELKISSTLTDAQIAIIVAGLDTAAAWQQIKGDFPSWYSLWIFRREMAQQGELLAQWSKARQAKGSGAGMVQASALRTISTILASNARLLEQIRRDTALAREATKHSDDILIRRDREGAAAAYALLFHVKLTAKSLPVAPPQTVDEKLAADFLGYMHSEDQLAVEAYGDSADAHAARVKLLGRFGRFYVRARISRGDEELMQYPARANTERWDAVLSDVPPSRAPVYEAALATDHEFKMQLQWRDWTDAFGASYSYYWEFIQIPDSELAKPHEDVLQAAGQRPESVSVLDSRLARARRYNAADIEHIRRKLGDGVWGQAAEGLAEIGNGLRIVGTVIRHVLEKMTDPQNVERYVFPVAGFWIVRCRAVPVLEGDEEIKRMPSVAAVPVVARDPDEVAVDEVRARKKSEFLAHLRIAEIQSLLASPFPPENSDSLRKEMKELQLMTMTPSESLQERVRMFDEQIAVVEKRLDLRKRMIAMRVQPDGQRNKKALAELQRQLVDAGGENGNSREEEHLLTSLQNQRTETATTLQMDVDTRKNETGMPFSPTVTFVSDLGGSLQLAINMYDRGEQDGVYEVFMSDLSMPDSGQALGRASMKDPNPRLQAIQNGLKKLLEESSDYGRGRVAVDVDGTVHMQRVEAGTGRMLTEAADNAATVGSLAAIALAPITDGASLYLLLPLGAAGAVTSGYRLYERYDENRLRFDFNTAMDVVNVVGGVLGLAEVATPLRAVRLGKVLMVMGVGVNGTGICMLGAGVLIQLDALQSLPEEERAARMLEILGQAMIQTGIQVGGSVMHARYQSRRAGMAATENGPLASEPGFHRATPEELARAAEAPATANERSIAVNGSSEPGQLPGHGAPVGTTAASGPGNHASPERLFERLQKGVDKGKPPPLPAEAVKHPPKAGEYQSGMTTADAAYNSYNAALAVSAAREVAIYYKAQTGEYRVMVGSETGVRAPEGGVGWDTLVHYHPNEGNALTFRLPAPQDFSGLMMRFMAEGVAVREFLEFHIPGVGRGRTEFGIEPNQSKPFYVRINQADGTSRTLRFANDGRYTAYWGERTIAIPEGSPVYMAMIRDIQDYVRATRDNSPESATARHPSETDAQSRAGAPGEDRSRLPSAERTTAGIPASKLSGPLQSAHGDLTDLGVAFIRSRFKRVGEAKNKSTELAHLTDQQIKERFKNQPNWLEAIVVAEVRGDWLGRSTKTDFVMSDPHQTFNDIAARLRNAVTSGKTGQTLNTGVLLENVRHFVDERVRQGDPGLTAAFNACEHNRNPSIRARWREFQTSAEKGDMSGFFLGKVGSKKPDIVEVMLSQNAIHITDATFAYGDPIHNFKSAFYQAVVQQLIDVKTVTSTDYRAPFKQTPVGP